MSEKKIKTALISVFDKDGLSSVIPHLRKHKIEVYSTGGTYDYLVNNGMNAIRVEDITGYPSILDGRVKTLHPKVFGGILARREDEHMKQLEQYEIPALDLVIVDLYPFEKTVMQTDDESAIIEKIDIGGISLIRAAAKNYRDVLCISSRSQYAKLEEILSRQDAVSSLAERKELAARSFDVSSHYDHAIFNYFNSGIEDSLPVFKKSIQNANTLRYGENPHQEARFYGELNKYIDQLSGKAISYNNLVDIDSAIQIISEFRDSDPCFVVIKHTNSCGVAIRENLGDAWHAALQGDPTSAFGGIFICNKKLDRDTAIEINKLFYEVLIAPDFEPEALEILVKKKKRIIIKLNAWYGEKQSFKSLLGGVIFQEADRKTESVEDMKVCTELSPDADQLEDLKFANIVAKHLKSNTIVIASRRQLLGMGCGQTSRVDACNQAIEKAGRMGFKLEGAVMASDAFFPFPDCVELANKAGIKAVIQPGGSINDQLSIDYCNENKMSMVLTGARHFKH